MQSRQTGGQGHSDTSPSPYTEIEFFYDVAIVKFWILQEQMS